MANCISLLQHLSKSATAGLLSATFMLATGFAAGTSAKGVQVIPDVSNRRVDIRIDGRAFTSYIWPSSMKKPVLYPILDSDGVIITRGYPLDPRPGERTDHPHHVGLWFNYGNVNGFDFWNNSNAIKPENRSKMGMIVFDKIVSAKSGVNRGELVTDSTWITGKNRKIMTEKTRYIFTRMGSARAIDTVATLTALEQVVFHDDKEGLLGLRVARWLESPDAKGGTFTDANGNPTKVAAASSLPGVAPPTGEYLTSQGVKGMAVWSTRGRWCSLTGHENGHTDTIAIFDHPGNPDYPTYWHARGYGLFAANPLARSIFDPKQPPLNFTLQKGQSVTFRYRIVIYPSTVTPKELNREADAFASESQ